MCSFYKLATKEEGYSIHLVERNILQIGYSSDLFETKNFTKPSLIQDFPARGKFIFLSMKRRRWREKNSKNNIIRRDLSFLTNGIKMTADLSSFLKGTHRIRCRISVAIIELMQILIESIINTGKVELKIGSNTAIVALICYLPTILVAILA
ncbi:MAG: hypothetical protein ACI9K1_001899 [Arcticibacterium sp.]|jgi:hypothetical protein